MAAPTLGVWAERAALSEDHLRAGAGRLGALDVAALDRAGGAAAQVTGQPAERPHHRVPCGAVRVQPATQRSLGDGR